ncbi:uncharacterized protein BKA78DRAFT_162971 [Phyllosticta capitalensis]|uniref:uncharacterized protein n=1 Tax=Phyllosticta capitalensis TaxID=121624 RepID=UPI00312FBFFB
MIDVILWMCLGLIHYLSYAILQHSTTRFYCLVNSLFLFDRRRKGLLISGMKRQFWESSGKHFGLPRTYVGASRLCSRQLYAASRCGIPSALST